MESSLDSTSSKIERPDAAKSWWNSWRRRNRRRRLDRNPMKMRKSKSGNVAGRLIVAAALCIAATAIACTEDVPTSAVSKKDAPDLNNAAIVAALRCHASTADLSVTCDAPSGAKKSDDETQSNIIIGGQDVFVAVKSSNVGYNAGTGAFTFDVTIRNLIPQAMGTADTTGAQAPDPNGIRIFFASGPIVTGGSGLITVVGDGVATFTGANQPYYQYNTVLDQFEISTPKTWQLTMPPSVTTFDFLLLVSASVPRPDGYIDLQVSSLRPPLDRQMTYTVRNANGTIDAFPGAITWWVSDTTRATIDANGLVNPLRTGNVTIYAQVGLKVGVLNTSVARIRRYWLGATSNQWATGTNWWPDGVKPEPTDTAVVPDTTSSVNFPTLAQNESIGGVEVHDLTPGGVVPTVSLGAFNLTASGDVETTNSGSITSSSGQLVLSGIARTVRGLLPRINVIGTYSLTGNITVAQRIQVQAGRLTNTAFRIQQNP